MALALGLGGLSFRAQGLEPNVFQHLEAQMSILPSVFEHLEAQMSILPSVF